MALTPTPIISFDKWSYTVSITNGGAYTSSGDIRYGYKFLKRNVGITVWTTIDIVNSDLAALARNMSGLIIPGQELAVQRVKLDYDTEVESSAISNVVAAETVLRPPILTYNAVTNVLSGTDASGNISAYKIYKANSSVWELIATVVTTATSFSQSMDGLVATSADLMVRTEEVGGTLSADSKVITIIMENSSETSSYTLATTTIYLDTLREVYNDPAVSFQVNTLRVVRGDVSVQVDTLRRIILATPVTVNVDTLRRVINLAPSPLTPDSKTISFVGQLQPGDVLEIDLKAMTATLNGVNVLHLISGDIFDFMLLAGDNELQYSDESASRNLSMEIDKRTKYL